MTKKSKQPLELKKVAKPVKYQMGVSNNGNNAYLTVYPDGMGKIEVGKETIMIKTTDLKTLLFMTDQNQQRYLAEKKVRMHTQPYQITFLAPYDCKKGDKVSVIKEVPTYFEQQI